MDNIQKDMLAALNEYISTYKRMEQRECCGDYSEEYATGIWTLQQLKEQILLHDDPPLKTIEKFQRKLDIWSYNCEIFNYGVETIDMFLRTVL